MSLENRTPEGPKEFRDAKIVDELQTILDQQRDKLSAAEIQELETAIGKGRSALSKNAPMSEQGFFTLYTLSLKYKPKESPEKK